MAEVAVTAKLLLTETDMQLDTQQSLLDVSGRQMMPLFRVVMQ